MARSGRATFGRVAAAVVAVALALGGCTGSDGTSGDGDVGADWVAAELGSVPEGYSVRKVDQHSSDGRRIGYGTSDGRGDDDDWQISVTSRVPMEWTVERMLAAYDDAQADGRADEEPDPRGEVRGHEAVVFAATSDGRPWGWQVVWEEVPGLQVDVHDMRDTATRDSALELAEGVAGLTRAQWDEALGAYEATTEYAGPAEGAVEREVADGVLDARQWTLSAFEDPADTMGFQSCFRLSYAGEDTGPGCSVQRVVLAGKGFVIGWTGRSGEAPELLPGPGSSFDPIRPQVHAFGSNLEVPESHVWVAVLPDDACGVEYRRPGSDPIETAVSLNLLPGDPGAAECATR